MAAISLLHYPSNPMAQKAWAFEHAMSHRNALGPLTRYEPKTVNNVTTWHLRETLSRFSVVPYFIDPMIGADIMAGKYLLNHQQAHSDALNNIPDRYYWKYLTSILQVPNPNPPPPTLPQTSIKPQTIKYGLRIGGNLIDWRLSNKRQRTWWTFQNHMEHYVASQSIAPAPAPKPAPQWTFPFW